MFRLVLSAAILFFTSTAAFAAEITPSTLIGRYRVSARVGLARITLNFNVINAREFEVQRVHGSGQVDETCNGTYELAAQAMGGFNTLLGGELLSGHGYRSVAASKIFRGEFTCPSNRSKTITLSVNFRNATTQRLARGTTVMVKTSLVPGRTILATMRRL